MKSFKIALVATALLSVAAPFAAQAQSSIDDTQQLIAQIQADKRAVVLKAMALDDAQLTARTTTCDARSVARTPLVQRGWGMLNAVSSNYDSMTDGAAKGLLKDWFKLQDDELALMKGTAKKLDRILPTAKVLRFVQVENKLNTLLRLPGIQAIPLAK